MKWLWIVLGVLLGLCLICGGGFYFLFSKAKGTFDEAAKFGDSSFTAIATSWDINEFNSRAAPEIAEQNGKNAVPELMNRLSTSLGKLKGTVSGHITNLSVKDNNGVNAEYADWKADVTFEKGPGQATMQLISRNGKWQIIKFDVVSDLLK